MKIVISIGGSLLTKEAVLTNPESYAENFKKYVNVVKELHDKGHKLIVVCGGGAPARLFQEIGRKFTKNLELLDRLGIVATDLNAYIFVAALGELSYQRVLKKPEEVESVFKETNGKKIIVCSGWEPGCSTDLDAAMHAERIQADILINATNIDGVYTTDPKKDPNAKKLQKIGYKKFREIISAIPQTPGEYRLFDLKAIDILEKSKIKLIIIDGNDPDEILRAVDGKHNGTVVS